MPTPAHLRCGPSADEPTVSAQPEHVAVREMPSLFRLVSIKYSQVAPRRFRCGATLFADGQDVRVAWECAQPDTRLNPGVQASIRLGAFPGDANVLPVGEERGAAPEASRGNL